MGMGPASPTQIPNFISAASPNGLRRLMLLNNIKLGSFIKYFNIQFVNGKWIAWFYSEVQTMESKSILETKV